MGRDATVIVLLRFTLPNLNLNAPVVRRRALSGAKIFVPSYVHVSCSVYGGAIFCCEENFSIRRSRNAVVLDWVEIGVTWGLGRVRVYR